MAYASRLVGPLLILLAVAPFALLGARKKAWGKDRTGLAFAGEFFALSSALQLLPSPLTSRWNWTGKLLEGALALTAATLWPRLDREETGLVARLRDGSMKVLPLLLLLPAYTALFRFGFGNPGVRGTEALLFQLLIPGPVEEFAYRGVLQGFVRRSLGPGWAVGLTAVVFGLVHVVTSGPSGLALAPENLDLVLWGLILGIVRERTGTLWPGMLAHAAANAITAVP